MALVNLKKQPQPHQQPHQQPCQQPQPGCHPKEADQGQTRSNIQAPKDSAPANAGNPFKFSNRSKDIEKIYNQRIMPKSLAKTQLCPGQNRQNPQTNNSYIVSTAEQAKAPLISTNHYLKPGGNLTNYSSYLDAARRREQAPGKQQSMSGLQPLPRNLDQADELGCDQSADGNQIDDGDDDERNESNSDEQAPNNGFAYNNENTEFSESNGLPENNGLPESNELLAVSSPRASSKDRAKLSVPRSLFTSPSRARGRRVLVPQGIVR